MPRPPTAKSATTSATASAATRPADPGRRRRALLWMALLLLLGVAQTLLVVLTAQHESTRAQDEAEAVAAEAAAEVRRELTRHMLALQALTFGPGAAEGWNGLWQREASDLLRQRHELRRIERRDATVALLAALDTPFHPPLFERLRRSHLALETELACAAAQRSAAPTFSRTYFVPLPDGHGLEVLDLCVPVPAGGTVRAESPTGPTGPTGPDSGGTHFLVGTFALNALLDGALSSPQARRHELSFIEGDGTRLARAGLSRGAGVFRAERVVTLPGVTLQLRSDSASGRPSLIPNLATGLVLGLSLALFALVLLLARDVRRRAQAEAALAEALAVRKAMEDSLITGLRARDLQGAITYVNPAFCAMVGFDAQELTGPGLVPPYWPPEHVAAYSARQRQRLAADDAEPRSDAEPLMVRRRREAREGHETVFMRKNGERFPVMIYEAPLVDGLGRHTGWMSAVLDISAQRRVEELSRQQQDRLQATARLTTVGEMASLLSHELNQPLSAIASYASGSLNMLQGDPAATPAQVQELHGMLQQALGRIAEQAERAGRIIKSVHDFVRRRENQHETVAVDVLVEAVLPLVRLQARKSGTRVEVDLPGPADVGPGGRMPRVRCDRTLLEQVLLNLTRNGIQAMEGAHTPLDARVLTIRVRQQHAQWVGFSVIDAGPGIAADVAQRLFTPFFTTRSEGMGLGLSLCRTVVEQHGGALDFAPGPWREGLPRGTEFRFTLPTPRPPGARRAGAAALAADATRGDASPDIRSPHGDDTPGPAPSQDLAESGDTAAPAR